MKTSKGQKIKKAIRKGIQVTLLSYCVIVIGLTQTLTNRTK